MEEYKKHIERLAVSQSPMNFFNSGEQHAAIVMATIFNNSKKNVNIFAGNFGSNISKDANYLESIKNYLHKGGKLYILLESFEYNKNPKLFDILFTYKAEFENVTIKLAKSPIISHSSNKIHFTTAEDRIFRLEYDTSKYEATGSFNDPKTVHSLNQVFNNIFNDSQKSTEVYY